jgi:hypothetical protein
MKTMMTVAAGLAIGYFVWQYLAGSRKGTTNGKIHRSTRDRKLAGFTAPAQGLCLMKVDY